MTLRFNYSHFQFKQSWMVLLVCTLGTILIWSAIQLGKNTTPLQHFGKGVAYLADSQSAFSHENVAQLPDSAWNTEKKEQLAFGFSAPPHWFKFALPRASNASERLLEIDYALLDSVEIWFYSEGQVLSTFRQGDLMPFNARLIKHEKFLFPVPQVENDIVTIIRAQSVGTLKLPIRLWDKQRFLVFNGEHSVLMGLFFGFMAAMALSNLFFFVTTRSYTFLSYCGYVVCVGLTLASLHGMGYKYLWPDNIWLQSRNVGIFATAALVFAFIFSSQVLEVRSHSAKLNKVLIVSSGVFTLATVLCMIIPYDLYMMLFLPLLCVAMILIYGVGSYLWFKGVRLARFYTIAWTALFISGLAASLDSLNIITLDTPSHYLLMFGATVETFLLALALAISYNHQRQELFDTQTVALQKERLAREAQDNVLKVKEEAQEELEYKVQERTLELEIALRELSETNRELEKKNTMDSLTGIRNRAYFDKKLIAEVRRSRREQTELSIVMIDIDHFKKINDTYGHLVGDDCIRFVADILKQNLKRPSDDVCRYGGEEFSLILPNTSVLGAEQVVEEMRLEVERTAISSPEGPINMTISAGICTAVVNSVEDETHILENADNALYQAKEQGRNRVSVSSIKLNSAINQE